MRTGAYWFAPTVAGDDHMAEVVSSTLTDLGWAHSEIVPGDPIAAVRELKIPSRGCRTR